MNETKKIKGYVFLRYSNTDDYYLRNTHEIHNIDELEEIAKREYHNEKFLLGIEFQESPLEEKNTFFCIYDDQLNKIREFSEDPVNLIATFRGYWEEISYDDDLKMAKEDGISYEALYQKYYGNSSDLEYLHDKGFSVFKIQGDYSDIESI